MLFESSKPVYGKYFFDREMELKELIHTVPRLKKGATTYLALLGHRKVGKTSLLEKFREEAENDIYTAKIDCWEKENLSLEFFRDYAIRIINASLLRMSGRKFAPLESYLMSREKLIGLLAEIKNLNIRALEAGMESLLALEEGKYSGLIIGNIIDLPEKIAQELKIHFGIIIDEFQELGELNKFKAVKQSIGKIYSFLRSRWQNHRRVNYFVAGSKISLMKKILTKKNAPFFQHFKIMEIGVFSENEAKKMLKVISSSIDREIPAHLISKIIEIVGTNPFYLQIIGEELCRKNKIDDDALKVTLQEVLFNESGRLYLYFEDLFYKVVGNSASCENALIAIARQEGPLGEKARELGVTPGALKTWLKRVSDLIAQRERIYQISDPCLKLWLKNRSGIKKALPPLILGDRAEKLVAQILSDLGFQLIYQSRASRGAFDLLGIIGLKRIGIQVKRGGFPVYIKKSEINEMKFWGKELSWLPVIAVVWDDNCRFYLLRNLKQKGKYFRIDRDTKPVINILDAL